MGLSALVLSCLPWTCGSDSLSYLKDNTMSKGPCVKIWTGLGTFCIIRTLQLCKRLHKLVHSVFCLIFASWRDFNTTSGHMSLDRIEEKKKKSEMSCTCCVYHGSS